MVRSCNLPLGEVDILANQSQLASAKGAFRVFRSGTGAPVLLAFVVFAACLFGIFSRPVGFLATLWPANAIMLGLLIRFPRTAVPIGWLGAGLAYVAADLLTGASIEKAIILNGANIAGVAVGYFLYRRETGETANLRYSASMFHLLFAAATAGAAAGLIGALANPVLFGGGAIEGWSFWFATELVNYVTFLPVILAMPSRHSRVIISFRWQDAVPAIAVIGSCLLASIGSGPGAIAFPVPALLWCALSYSVFGTAALTALYGCWALIAVGAGVLPFYTEPYDERALVSLRIAVALVSMAPIMLASAMQSRNDLLARLRHEATHDSLTGLLNRSAFRDAASQAVVSGGKPLAIMMVDIDRFKSINDNYGHAGGDEVLTAFAERVRSCLRREDMFARMGGEEFAVLIESCAQEEAIEVANRILAAIRTAPVVLSCDREASLTASIGLVITRKDEATSMDDLLAAADAELYCAKRNGRDRLEIAGSAHP